MTNKIEKGQKYKGDVTGKVYEILSDVFDVDGVEYVAWRWPETVIVQVDAVENFYDSSLYTLIPQPKFKVGDRVTYPHGGEVYEIVAVSPDADPDGDFGHLVKSKLGWFCLIHNPKAAE